MLKEHVLNYRRVTGTKGSPPVFECACLSVTTKQYGKRETVKGNQSEEARKRPNFLRNKERNTTRETTLRLQSGEAPPHSLEAQK